MSKKNVKKELGRIKEMMSYGLSEGKKNTPFSDVEYSRVGADGKLYGIVREGTKYYIKSAPQNVKPIKENFDYIGGFVNRKNNEYSSYANALKQFDLKMASLKEANAAGKKIMVESWNPDKRRQLTVESTNQMKREIARERQIMYNVGRINENKKQECGCCGDPFCKNGEVCHCDDMDIDKMHDNIGRNEYRNGVRKGHGIKKDKAWKKADLPKDMFEGRSDDEVLGWNDDYDYIDDSHGTEIGADDPFTEPRFTNRKRMRNGVVGEGRGKGRGKGKALHRQFWDQNSPTPGTSDWGDGDPFTKPVNEAITDMDADVDNGGGLIDKINDMEDTLNNIASVLGIESNGMDNDMSPMGGDMSPMGGDMSPMGGGMPPMGGGMPPMGGGMPPMGGGMPPMGGGMPPMGNPDMMGNANGGDFNDSDLYNQQPANEGRVYESRDFRRMLNEDRLDYFGKHPAWQKRVMSLPKSHHSEFPGYYDMNDESVYSEDPYGEQIGDGAPFLVDPDELENAIAESIIRNLKKK